MAISPDNRTPATPEATAAVAQSRLGVPAARDSGLLDESQGPGGTFSIGPGVERAAHARPHERRSGDPVYRPLRIFALDPAASRFEGAVATVNVPYEPLAPGPCGALVEVDNYDGWQQVSYQRLNLDDPKVLLQNGRTPSPSDPLFHQQMVYTVGSTVSAAFQRALGRHIAWGFDNPPERAQEPVRLRLRPHAFEGRNAFYNRSGGEICFGYFRAGKQVTGRNPPFGFVFTCLSHDIVTHEVTHALLDGLREHYIYPTSPDMLAFHEAFADLVAIFQRFNYTQVVETAFRTARGRLDQARSLTGLARQFGDTTGLHRPLRSAIDVLDAAGRPVQRYQEDAAPHALGSVLVAAVFEAFLTVFKRKTARAVRLATSGTGELPDGDIPADLRSLLAEEASQLASQFLTICIRAIDYCPPVDLQLGEYLRALITADYDLVPSDPWGYREAFIDAFWRRELYPAHVTSLFEDALLWRPTRQPLPPITALTFAELKFAGDPGRPAGASELRRQASALGRFITQPEYMTEFGLVPPDHPALGGDTVAPPCIASIRSTRRVGPDGQVVFDLVAEVTQRRTVRRPDGRPEFDHYGGATIIVGPNGEIRYVISKSVLNRERYERQRAFIHGQGRAFWHAQTPGGTFVPQAQLFRLLDRPEEDTGRAG